MIRQIVFALGLSLVPVLAFAQDATRPSASTTVPSYGRYEIVQSPLVASLTIRLDRFTGSTWQFVTTKNGDFAWQLLPRVGADAQKLIQGRVNYQLFTSGIVVKVTILMNVNTGQSWYIAEDSKKGELWAPMQ